jgi:hypothetical protein
MPFGKSVLPSLQDNRLAVPVINRQTIRGLTKKSVMDKDLGVIFLQSPNAKLWTLNLWGSAIRQQQGIVQPTQSECQVYGLFYVLKGESMGLDRGEIDGPGSNHIPGQESTFPIEHEGAPKGQLPPHDLSVGKG